MNDTHAYIDETAYISIDYKKSAVYNAALVFGISTRTGFCHRFIGGQ